MAGQAQEEDNPHPHPQSLSRGTHRGPVSPLPPMLASPEVVLPQRDGAEALYTHTFSLSVVYEATGLSLGCHWEDGSTGYIFMNTRQMDRPSYGRIFFMQHKSLESSFSKGFVMGVM